MDTDSVRPAVTELRLSAFKSHRGATFPLGPLTLLTGASGSGKSGVLQAYEILARLGSGARLERAVAAVPGGATGCVPAWARPDEQGRRGFRIGCTVDGPVGPVRLDVAVQADPELRIVGERLTGGGETLLTTALTDPARRAVQAAWYTAGSTPVTRAPLPDDRLGTALLPLRVAGKTAGQRLVLAAAEQVVVALRTVFACDPRPEAMRGAGAGSGDGAGASPSGGGTGTGTGGGSGAGDGGRGAGGRAGGVGGAAAPGARTETGTGTAGGFAAVSGGDGMADDGGTFGGGWGWSAGDGRLRTACDNLPAVLGRTSRECSRRHALLVEAVGAGCVGPVEGLRAEPVSRAGTVGMRALVERGALPATPLEQLGDGELRYLALALVLLTGPEVLAMDPVGEVLSARQVLGLVTDGMDRCLDGRQARALLELAVRMVGRGHVRLLGTVRDASAADGLPGVRVLHLGA
ncbi:biotin transporter BioY [Streptomyces sp. NPDC007100]|uniref:biotin transporter BioY n=1 Tax=Streptomyces sp. NPDC007100 TaxID=3155602 RepID=UPI0033FB5B7F